MLVYKIVWEKDGKEGSFEVHGYTDEQCIKDGHAEVESFGGEVTDYYQVSPSTDKLVRKLLASK